MRPFICLLSALYVACRDGNATGVFTPTAQPLHINDGNFSKRDHMRQEPFQHQPGLNTLQDSTSNLKVQVNDFLSRQPLSQAVVDVYINYTRTHTVLTGEDGSALLHVPYQTRLPVAVVARKHGYIWTLLPCKPNRLPIFSSVTMSLFSLNQGNIWFFDDSVLITGKTSDVSLKPIVQFPKSLLNLTDSSNVTSIEAYLTIPRLPFQEEDKFMKTWGIMSTKSGYVSVELSPLAAVSVQLFSGNTELHVTGPIRISLNIPDNCGLQTSNVVPAWFFNQTTGGWMRKGLGVVVSVDGKLTWKFTAPQLGYWIAAPLTSTGGFFGLDISADFILHHSSFLLVILGGMLVIVICLLLSSCYLRHSLSEAKTKRVLSLKQKDQTTSTSDDEVLEASSVNSSQAMNGAFTDREGSRHNTSVISTHNGNVIANPSTVAIAMECNGLELDTSLNDMSLLHPTAEHIRVPASLVDNLFFYNQPVAILHTPTFLHLEEQPEHPQMSKAATLPRAGATNITTTEPLSKDSFTQTVSKGPAATRNQAEETERGLLESSQEATSSSVSRDHFSLPESVSVPGTLHKIGGNRHSVHALAELSEIPSLQPPRAWFVSLEGKPAAEIHYAVSEQQRRRRPAESRETSLDSGVDMSELNQTSGRRVTLERNATFVKSTSGSKQSPHQHVNPVVALISLPCASASPTSSTQEEIDLT